MNTHLSPADQENLALRQNPPRFTTKRDARDKVRLLNAVERRRKGDPDHIGWCFVTCTTETIDGYKPGYMLLPYDVASDIPFLRTHL